MCQLIIAGLVEGEYDPTNTMLWRDWLYPFPMEGAAVVIIALALYPLLMNLKKRFKNPVIPYVVSFLANALTCSLIEFSMGLIVNADLQLWDYTNNFGNIMGQVCLQNTIAFGIAASVIAWFVYPMLERWIARQPSDVMNIVFVGILVFGLIVWSLYLITPPDELDVGAPKTEEELAQEERDAIETELLLTDTMVDSLYEQVQGSEYLSEEEQQELLEHLAEVNQELESAGEVLGMDVGELAA